MGNVDSEKYIELKLKEGIENLGGIAIKFLPKHFNGFPDRMCLIPHGKVIFVELKSKGIAPRKLQIHVHSLLTRMGFSVEVIDSIDSLKSFLSGLQNHS